MLSTKGDLPKSAGARRFGFATLVGSCLLTTLTIGLVMRDESKQRERRQIHIRERLRRIQQKRNISEYELQRKRYEDFKRVDL